GSFERTGRPLGEGTNKLGDASSPDSKDVAMEMFFVKVGKLEEQIELITAQLHKLQEANRKSQHVTNAAAMKEIKEKMEKEVDEVKAIALKVKKGLEELDKDTLRQEMQEEYREVVARRVYTEVTGTRPDEDTIENLIETGRSEQIFTEAIQGHGRGEIVATLAEIQERHDTVKDIEKKLLDLQQMFVDMSVLVEAQGDMLDDIEAQVTKAVEHVQSATKVLKKGKELQRNTRKYTCLAIALLLVIIIAVLSMLKPDKLFKSA
ncbi:hypothetical protein Taro_051726, partial [Colocasia esculenta]|nr:hypothetical protein [Colocasia esculenta]